MSCFSLYFGHVAARILKDFLQRPKLCISNVLGNYYVMHNVFRKKYEGIRTVSVWLFTVKDNINVLIYLRQKDVQQQQLIQLKEALTLRDPCAYRRWPPERQIPAQM